MTTERTNQKGILMNRTTTLATLAVATLAFAAPASATIHTDRIDVGQHHVVRSSTLPSCDNEDGSSGPLPCSWNFVGHHDGNGAGLAYWIDRKHRVHYVWPSDPTDGEVGPQVHWMTSALADAIAEGDTPLTGDWHRYIWCHVDGHTVVAQPNGNNRRVS